MQAALYATLHGWAQNGISRFGPTTRITQHKYNDQGSFICVEYNWSDFNLQNVMAEFLSGDFAVWEAPASLKRYIEVILRKELKQSYCEIWKLGKFMVYGIFKTWQVYGQVFKIWQVYF